MSTFQIQKKNTYKDTPYISISNSKSDSSNYQVEQSHLSINSNQSNINTALNNNNPSNNNINTNITCVISYNSDIALNKSFKNTASNNQLSFDNLSFLEDSKSNNNLQISSNSIVFKKNDTSTSNILNKQSILNTPSTICNYITPNKNINEYETNQSSKPKLKQINLTNGSKYQNNFVNTSRSDENNISLISENATNSNGRKFYFDKKTPIKYTKSQLKSGEKKEKSPIDGMVIINNQNLKANSSEDEKRGDNNENIAGRKNLMDTFEKISKEKIEFLGENRNINKDPPFIQVLSVKEEKENQNISRINQKQIKLIFPPEKKKSNYSFDKITLKKQNAIKQPQRDKSLGNNSKKKNNSFIKNDSESIKPSYDRRPLSFTKNISFNGKKTSSNNQILENMKQIKKRNPNSDLSLFLFNRPNSAKSKKLNIISGSSSKNLKAQSPMKTIRTYSEKKTTANPPFNLKKKNTLNHPLLPKFAYKTKSKSKTKAPKINFFDIEKPKKPHQTQRNFKPCNNNNVTFSANKICTTSSSKSSTNSTEVKEHNFSNKKFSDIKVNINLVEVKLSEENNPKILMTTTNTNANKKNVINNFSNYKKKKNTKAESKKNNKCTMTANNVNSSYMSNFLKTQVKFAKLQSPKGDSGDFDKSNDN